MKKILSVFLCAVLIAMLLCGCGGSSKTESAPHMDAAKAGGSSASYAANGSVGWTMDEAAEAPMAMEPKAESQTGSSLPANVKLIYRANIDMESTEFDKALDGLNELVERMGGYYENSELNLSDKRFSMGRCPRNTMIPAASCAILKGENHDKRRNHESC